MHMKISGGADNYGQIYGQNIKLTAISKEEMLENIEKRKDTDEAAVAEISSEGRKKLTDELGKGGKIHIEMTEEEKEERAVKEKAFQAMIKPGSANKVLSREQLKPVTDFGEVIKANAPELSVKIDDLMAKIASHEPGEKFADEFLSLFDQADKVYADVKKNGGAPILNDYDALLGFTASDFRAQRSPEEGYSITDRAEDVTKAYAAMYSQIVKGYEDGSRKSYAIDETSENGYRLMTMEEELAELDKAYEKKVQGIDSMAKDSGKIAEALKKYEEQLAKYRRNNNAEEVKQVRKDYTKSLSTMPDDLGDRMMKVADLFKQNFQASKTLSMDFVCSLMNENYHVNR